MSEDSTGALFGVILGAGVAFAFGQLDRILIRLRTRRALADMIHDDLGIMIVDVENAQKARKAITLNTDLWKGHRVEFASTGVRAMILDTVQVAYAEAEGWNASPKFEWGDVYVGVVLEALRQGQAAVARSGSSRSRATWTAPVAKEPAFANHVDGFVPVDYERPLSKANLRRLCGHVARSLNRQYGWLGRFSVTAVVEQRGDAEATIAFTAQRNGAKSGTTEKCEVKRVWRCKSARQLTVERLGLLSAFLSFLCLSSSVEIGLYQTGVVSQLFCYAFLAAAASLGMRAWRLRGLAARLGKRAARSETLSGSG